LHTVPLVRGRVFYGWWVVVGAAAGHFASVAFTSVLAAVTLRPMTEELGWTFGQFTFATSAAALTVALTGPLVGPQIDRHGSRPLMLLGAVSYGAVLLATAWVTALWQFIALQLVAGVLARPLIGGVVVNVAVAKWFVRKRGWAISIASSGFSFGTMLMPAAATAVVNSVGWRDGYVVMACLLWALLVPAALLMRSAPEDYGLVPDGGSPLEPVRAGGPPGTDADFVQSLTRTEALRTSAFWRLLIAFSVFVGTNIAMLFHGIPFLTGAGFPPEQVGFAFGLTGVSGLLSKVAWGWGLAAAPPRRLATLALALAAAGTALTVAAALTISVPLMCLAFLLWGAGFGGVTPVSEFMWASQFGRRYLGAIRGAGVPAQVVVTAVAPLLVALSVDWLGSYQPAFLTMVGAYGLAALTVPHTRAASPS
jgi:MFS family permease